MCIWFFFNRFVKTLCAIIMSDFERLFFFSCKLHKFYNLLKKKTKKKKNKPKIPQDYGHIAYLSNNSQNEIALVIYTKHLDNVVRYSTQGSWFQQT